MTIEITQVTRANVAQLHQALTQLSSDIGDTHTASLETLTEAGFGPIAVWRGLLAKSGDTPVGALLASPLFSTTRGGAGLYISDLWVADQARGQGVGSRLLANACQEWSPTFVKLSVYRDNARALKFYRSLGFVPQDEANLTLQGPALVRLKGQT